MPEYHYHCSKCDGRLTYPGPDGEKVHCDCSGSIRTTEVGLCDHRNFQSSVDVNRLQDRAAFHVDIRIHCADCGMVFVFKGCKGGLDFRGPAVSPAGKELRIPIEPISPIVRKRPE